MHELLGAPRSDLKQVLQVTVCALHLGLLPHHGRIFVLMEKKKTRWWLCFGIYWPWDNTEGKSVAKVLRSENNENIDKWNNTMVGCHRRSLLYVFKMLLDIFSRENLLLFRFGKCSRMWQGSSRRHKGIWWSSHYFEKMDRENRSGKGFVISFSTLDQVPSFAYQAFSPQKLLIELLPLLAGLYTWTKQQLMGRGWFMPHVM